MAFLFLVKSEKYFFLNYCSIFFTKCKKEMVVGGQQKERFSSFFTTSNPKHQTKPKLLPTYLSKQLLTLGKSFCVTNCITSSTLSCLAFQGNDQPELATRQPGEGGNRDLSLRGKLGKVTVKSFQRRFEEAGQQKLIEPVLFFSEAFLTFMPNPLSFTICLCASRARERVGQIRDCFQSLAPLMMDYHVNLNGIGLICFNDFSLG